MKYRLALVLVILVVSGMVAALVGAQSTPDVTPTPRPGISSVIQQDIFVRAGPGQQYLPVGQLLAGNGVVPVARNAQGDWVLIIYRTSAYGWIRRDLATWVENIDALPVLSDDQLTPSPGFFPTNSPTPTVIFLPTDTPSGNYVLLPTDAQSGFVRAGPGRTFLRLGQLYPGDQVDPVGRDGDTVWILIRFEGGFGWIRADLVKWTTNLAALPILLPDNLTPTATFTPSNTPTITLSPTASPSATVTPSSTPTLTPSSTATATALPTSTPTITPSATATLAPTASDTLIPSVTATLAPTATSTETPTATNTTAPTQTAAPSNTDTPVPTATFTAVPLTSETPAALAVVPSTTPTFEPSLTFTSTPIPTLTLTVTPSATDTATATASATPAPPTATASATNLPPTATVIAVVLPTNTSVSSPVPSITPFPPNATVIIIVPTAVSSPVPSTSPTKNAATPTPTQASGAVNGAGATITPIVLSGSPSAANGGGIPLEALLAGLIVLLIVIYIALYYRGIMAANRYAAGFVLERCPVCGQGHLTVEARQERLFGVPRPRRIVRCDECRSLLRETSPRRWRYAIDPIANPDLYRRYNGQEFDEETLVELAHEAAHGGQNPVPRSPASPPDFVDDDQ